MAISNRSEPMVGLYFAIEIFDKGVARFAECSGFSIETTFQDYEEGGNPEYTYRYPVKTTYSNIVLKYGTHMSLSLFDWFMKSVDGKPERRDVTVKLLDSQGNLLRAWTLKDAYPVKWTGPTLRADKGDVATESLELAYSGISLYRN